MNKKDCAIVILAAGNSSRMGEPKFTLSLKDGTTFLENIIMQYSEFGCSEIIVVLNNKGIDILKKHPQNISEQTQIVLNPHPEYGRYYSIKQGVMHVRSNYTFVHNIDNPIVNHEVLNELLRYRHDAEVIKPISNGKGGHPVLISRNIIDYILLQEDNNFNFKVVLKMFTTREVEVANDSILININTKNEYVEFHRK